MKYIHYYILCLLSLVLLSSCMVEEGTVDSAEGQLVHKVFTATFEDSDMTTKTMLDETADEDGIRGLLWDPEDEIGVAQYNDNYLKFVNTIPAASSNGVFEGSVGQANVYYAVYPYQSSMRHAQSINVTIPTVQTYRENSFDRNMAPMVGRGNDGEPLHFMNICGVLAVHLTGTEKVKSIVFETMNGEKVSGVCSVDTDYVDYPVLDVTSATETYVSLDCGEGVQLSGEATPFHIVLPPGEYNGFTLYISTTDGKFMEKTTSKTLTIKRSIVTNAAALAFENNMTEITDLSERGHSNSYIVPSAGLYSFDADIIGNGEFGFIKGARFHTSNPLISPVSVELLWEDRPGLIKSWTFDSDDATVKFLATSNKGNALIAVKDAEGTILWSWHIWMTDQPEDQTYENDVLGEFVMLDRNVGAIRADRGTGDEWQESLGLYYQWGRKDPFAGGKFTNYSGQMTAAESLKNPTKIVSDHSNWTQETQVYFWSPDKKTIYDPCPVGYRMPPEDVWYGFTDGGNSQYVTESDVSNVTGENGWSFYCNSASETTWYPVNGYYTHVGSLSSSSYGYYWSADKNGGSPYNFYFRSDGYVYQNHTSNTYCAYNVRCMKDEEYEATSLPIVKMSESSEYTNSSVTFSANVSYKGWSEVTDRGFIYFANPDMSDAQTISCGSGIGEYTYILDGLSAGSAYYVKAYATNVYGTSYSDIRRYRTKLSDDIDNNLSSQWNANCYIVGPSQASYCFDATIVGNGIVGYIPEENFYPQNSLIMPSSAEILWEDISGVISDIMLQNGMVHFMTNDLEGNAVIAVKDATGVILWSWHIWVSDQPKGHTYVTNQGKTFVVMDRYLGSTSAAVGDEGGALYYQWGRKDPFKINESWLDVSFCGIFSDLSESISKPTYYPQGDDWVMNMSTSLWSTNMKTIYDPCPEGWRVPNAEVWSGIRKLTDHDGGPHGVIFGFSDTDSFWYPDAPRFNNYGSREGDYTDDNTEVWTSEYGVSYFLNYNGSNANYRAKCDAYPVRCMKDE